MDIEGDAERIADIQSRLRGSNIDVLAREMAAMGTDSTCDDLARAIGSAEPSLADMRADMDTLNEIYRRRWESADGAARRDLYSEAGRVTGEQKMRDLNRTRSIQHIVLTANLAGLGLFMYGAWRYLFRNR